MNLLSRVFTNTLHSRFAKEGAIVLGGDVIAKFLTFLISVIIVKFVKPEEYSYFGAFITLLAIVNQFTDSGLHQSFIRFYSKYKIDSPEKAKAYLAFSFRMKWIILASTVVILYFVAPIISTYFFHTEQLIVPIKLLSLGLIGGGMFEFISSVLQAKQKYATLSILRVAEAFMKIMYVGTVAYFGLFSLLQVYIAYTIVPVIIGGIALLVVGIHREKIVYEWREIGKEIFHFGKWLAIASVATMLYMRLDMLLVQFLIPTDKVSVGLYSLANRLCLPMGVFAGSVATVLYPKAMALRSLKEMKSYLKHSFRITIPISCIMMLYAVIIYFILPSLAPDYASAYPIFLILFVGWIFTIVVNPITMLMLTIGKSQIAALISIVQLILTIVLHTVFILWLGSIGAAVSSVIIWFFAGTGSSWYLFRNKHLIETDGILSQ